MRTIFIILHLQLAVGHIHGDALLRKEHHVQRTVQSTEVQVNSVGTVKNSCKDGEVQRDGICASVFDPPMPGWCRPADCDRNMEDCRVNGYYKDQISSSSVCINSCLDDTHCIGYAWSSQEAAFPQRCFIYSTATAVTDGWTAFHRSRQDISKGSRHPHVSCHRNADRTNAAAGFRRLHYDNDLAECKHNYRLEAPCGSCGPNYGDTFACNKVCEAYNNASHDTKCNIFLFYSDRGCKLYSECGQVVTRGQSDVKSTIYEKVSESSAPAPESSAPSSTPPPATTPPSGTGNGREWQEVGTGCCSGPRTTSGGKLFAGGGFSTVTDCQEKCLEFDQDCAFIDYFDTRWCFVWSTEQACDSLVTSGACAGAKAYGL